ncbi:penicillin-binding transpeptidase domain-containing protein [Pontibacter sp. G13]|uniref:penicillin-binding protein n=1 Tax=Pontibacter sp. G13 TaxID=3074898 RepID=UPI002889DFB0|nr:penicillin-binding transpeptidase domain-containing protein [Pontibacter sp. G13]WNJ20259.1 penicillin-binding transpeptidase domain-containing protein [Pontibacter sp. G13]
MLVLQLDQGEWARRELEDQIYFRKMVADRGSILAEDGTILATSLPFYRIGLDVTVIDTTAETGNYESFSDTLWNLSILLTQKFDEEESRDTLKYFNRVMEAIVKNDRHIYLTRNKLNFRELEEVKKWPILNRGRLSGGFAIEKFNNERFYPMEDLARITLGKLVDDTIATRGIEFSFNQELRGKDGYMLAQKVVGGSFIPVDNYDNTSAQDGMDVVTTLDVDMQDVVERALKNGVVRHGAKFGTAILMETSTGKIRAIANYPESPNHAIGTRIEPGSTFKTVSALALMEDGYVELCDTIDTGNGRIMYDDKEVTDNGVAWGRIDFEQVFAHSSNVGISKTVAEAYGETPNVFMNHLYRLGFYGRVNEQIKGEPVPRFISPEDSAWNIATLPSLSYGYSIEVAPIQMAAFFNGIANDGVLLRPYVVNELRENSRVINTWEPKVLQEKMCKPSTVEKLNELLKAVVRYGTARKAFRNMPFEVAGKTGTARKVVNGRYVKRYRASFGGYFPADEPRFTLYVMVDEPSQGGATSGGAVAAPIFRQIAEQVYRMDQDFAKPPIQRKRTSPPVHKIVHSNSARMVYQTLNVSTNDGGGVETFEATRSNTHQINFSERKSTEGRIPDTRGMSGKDALLMLEQLGIKVTIKGNGRVKRQSLLPGYKIGKGTSITLFLG